MKSCRLHEYQNKMFSYWIHLVMKVWKLSTGCFFNCFFIGSERLQILMRMFKILVARFLQWVYYNKYQKSISFHRMVLKTSTSHRPWKNRWIIHFYWYVHGPCIKDWNFRVQRQPEYDRWPNHKISSSDNFLLLPVFSL